MRIVIKESGADYPNGKKPIVKSPQDVFNIVKEVRAADKEVFAGAYLNARNGLIALDVVSVGLIDASLVHAREVFRTAVMKNAGAVILVHNHPSGDLTPSAEDVRITKQLVEAGKIIDIKVLDHVIVTESEYLSLREEGLVSFS